MATATQTTPISAEAFSAAPLQLLSEIIRQAEARLENQSELARAVDQRALALAGLAAAFAAAAITRAFEAWEAQPFLALLCGGAGASLLLSMLIAVLAARPAPIYVTGNLPSSWIDDIEAKRSYEACLADTAALYDKYIHANNKRLTSRNLFLRISLWFLFLTPLAAVATAFVGTSL